MTLIRRDRVVETTTSTGTGDLTLAGAVTGYRSFGGVMAIGNTCYCGVEAIGANGLPTGDWEIGLYTYSAANTLTRTTIHASSNSGAAVSFAAGTKRVIMGLTVADMANKMDSFAFRGTFTTANANYSWDFEDGVVPAAFTQTNALTVVDDLDGGVLQKSVTFNGGAAISASFATFQFSFDVVADASHTSVTIRSRIQCNYATGGAWEGLRFYVDGVDQGQIAQSVNAEAAYTDHVITGLAAGSHTIIVQFHTSAYADVGFQNVRIASISNGVVAASPYKLGDIVDYGIAGLRYMCMVAGTNALPTDATAWTCLGATYLSSLGDVDFSGGLTNGYVLTYNSASGKWKPGVVPTPTIQSLGGTSIGGATNGQAMAYNSSTGNWENKSLTFAALTDVGVSGVSNNQFLRYNLATTKWVPATMSFSYLSDVDLATATPTDGQVLTYSAASGKWIPGTPAGGGGGVTTAQVSARYWRLRFLALRTDNSTSGGSGFSELVYKNGAGTTISTGGTASASSITGGFPASNLFDGSTATSWYTANGKNIGEWASYDFGSAKTPASIVVTADPGFLAGMPLDFAIDYSSDGVAWRQHTLYRAATWVANVAQTFTIGTFP